MQLDSPPYHAGAFMCCSCVGTAPASSSASALVGAGTMPKIPVC